MESYKEVRPPLESRVRQLTKELAIYIDYLRAENIVIPPHVAKNYEISMSKLVEEMSELRATNAHGDFDTNPYFQFFLLLVCKYNNLFLRTGSTLAEAMNKKTPLLNRLRELNIKPINNLLLGSSVNTVLVYKQGVSNPAIFRDPYQRPNGDGRYFYDQQQASENYKDGKTFEEHYKEANRNIGLATQTSNLSALFRPQKTTQGANSFYRPRDKAAARTEKRLFREALKKLSNGEMLSLDERNVFLAGAFHRGTGSSLDHSIQKPFGNQRAKHFHRGHAGQEIDKRFLIVAVDPTNYHSGNQVLYKRHHEAGTWAKYLVAHIIWNSHEHYDHLDQQTLGEGFLGIDLLIIVSAGTGKYVRSWQHQNVIEFSSWNDFVEVSAYSDDGEFAGKLTVHAFPAKHASNRLMDINMPDINQSLYMGGMFHCEGDDHLTLVTGDTAVLDDQHMEQLQAFLFDKNVTVSSACIAAGPDRPRKWMECTHQSTADALVLHAKLNFMNARVAAIRNKGKYNEQEIITPEIFRHSVCHAIFYHQGCFRLGLLNYNDVEGTFTRILSVLNEYGTQRVSDVLPSLKAEYESILKIGNGIDIASNRSKIKSFPFAMMDNFERAGLIALLEVYQEPDPQVSWLIQLICASSHLPRAGELLDFNKTQKGFSYEYHRLIVNDDAMHSDGCAYGRIIKNVGRIFFDTLQNIDEENRNKNLVKCLFDIYLNKTSWKLDNKKEDIINYYKLFPVLDDSDVVMSLAFLQGVVHKWKTADDMLRDEGDFQTLITVAYGLLIDDKFKAKFIADCIAVRPEVGEVVKATPYKG